PSSSIRLATCSTSPGLNHIPIRLVTAVEDRSFHFHLLHKEDVGRVRYRKECTVCGKELSQEDLVKGYPVGEGRYVILEEEELAALPLPSQHTIEIEDFIAQEEIDPIYFQRSYFILPEGPAARPYGLLRAVLRQRRRSALGRLALRQKESLALIRLYGPVLLLETLHHPEEIKPVAPEDLPEMGEPGERELELALELVEKMTVPFQPHRYPDRYREAVARLVEQKMAGEKVAAPTGAAPLPPQDLVEALRLSLERTRQKEVSPRP
ncbi:MAG: Ku protein, partial [Bacillota bacterium]|nr:Ku protein [Bacillota bacterium]